MRSLRSGLRVQCSLCAPLSTVGSRAAKDLAVVPEPGERMPFSNEEEEERDFPRPWERGTMLNHSGDVGCLGSGAMVCGGGLFQTYIRGRNIYLFGKVC